VKPGVALALIVKNDAVRLERCLKSVAEVVDEMHVVDTGSTDGTQDVAREFGANLLQKDWPQDFSIAINWALDLVSREWTLRLDSDEWLLPHTSHGVEDVIANSEAFASTVIREDYTRDGRFAETLAMRLWRTHPSMRMEGVIHEHFDPDKVASAQKDLKVVHSQIRLGHDGYLEHAQPDKHRRNLDLVQKELTARPGNLYYECERVRLLYHLNDPEADREADRIIDLLLESSCFDEPPTILAAAPITLRLDRMPVSELSSNRTTDLLRLARGWFGDDPSTTYAAAKTFIRRGDLRSALDALLDLERMSETGEYSRAGFAQPSMLQEALWQNLALVAHQLGRKEIAARNYERLLKFDPRNAVALKNMPLLLRP
jgi:hypothetical protein